MNFNDLSKLGSDQGTLSILGCLVLSIVGGYGQFVQMRKIWNTRKADCVSGIMCILMCSLFSGYLIRGVAEWKIVFLFQGAFRIALFVPIIWGIVRFGEFSTKDKWAIGLSAAILMAMIVFEKFRVTGFLVVIYIGLVGNIHQAWKVRRENGQVSFVFYFTMFLSVSCQVWYGWHFKEWAIFFSCASFVIVYGIILLLLFKNKFGRAAVIA